MRKSTAWSGNRSGCSAIRRSTSNAVSILRRISVSVVSFLLEPRFHQRTVPLLLAREILAEYICVRRRSVNRHPSGRTGPPGHYHFDDRARRVILPAAVATYRGGTSWHIWYWPCSPSPSSRRSERVWPCIRLATSWQAAHRPAAWRAVRTITKRTIGPAKGMRRATTTRRSGPTRPPTTHSRLARVRSRITTRPAITTTRRPSTTTMEPRASRTKRVILPGSATPTRTKRRTTEFRPSALSFPTEHDATVDILSSCEFNTS